MIRPVSQSAARLSSLKSIRKPKSEMCRAFSLVELLVVIGLIAVLISVLVPTVSRVRRAAWTASTQALISKIQGAIERYYQDHGAYPGPLPDQNPGGGLPYVGGSFARMPLINPVPKGFSFPPSGVATDPIPNTVPAATPSGDFFCITGTNNLVLGLLGGLYFDISSQKVQYNPALVGKGPATLNPARPGISAAYLDTSALFWSDEGTPSDPKKVGLFLYDGVVPANDSPIPSLVDTYPDAMPILYLRARRGATGGYQGVANYSNEPVGPSNPVNASAQYDLGHVLGYTSIATTTSSGYVLRPPSSISIGRAGALGASLRRNTVAGTHGLSFLDKDASTDKIAPAGRTARFPYEFSSYLTNPNLPGNPRAKDTYVLIAAGPDRIYGTDDDITTFGDVK